MPDGTKQSWSFQAKLFQIIYSVMNHQNNFASMLRQQLITSGALIINFAHSWEDTDICPNSLLSGLLAHFLLRIPTLH